MKNKMEGNTSQESHCAGVCGVCRVYEPLLKRHGVEGDPPGSSWCREERA